MASEKILNEKKELVAKVTDRLSNSASGVVIDYKGISVTDDTALRAAFRKANVEYTVLKNSILRFAADNANLSDLKSVLVGTTAIATCADDVIAPAKVVAEFAKKNEKVKIKGGYYDGNVVDVDTIVALSKIPPKDVLIAKMLGSFNAPITSLAIALNEIRKQKEEQAC